MISVTCAIIRKGERILVTQRSAAMKMPMKWEFPGGKVEPGESEEACLIRELREELNIEVRIIRKLFVEPYAYPDFVINLIPFEVEYVSGEVHLSEHHAYQWMRTEDLWQLDWASADIPIVSLLVGSPAG